MGGLKTQKRIAAEIMKCGVSRVRVVEEKDVGEALTREDVRLLIKKGKLKKVQKKGTSRVKARKLLSQKKRGRRRGDGSKKGVVRDKKGDWMSVIRAQRKALAELRDSGRLAGGAYRTLYLRAKGGMFRSKKHMMTYAREREFLKARPKGGSE